MDTQFNYPVRLLAELDRNPGGRALASASRGLANGDVATLMRRYAVQLMRRGVTERSCVVLALRSGPTALIAALATGLVGARWVAMHSRIPFAAMGTTHLLYEGPKPEGLRHPGTHAIDATWGTDPVGVPAAMLQHLPGFRSAEDIALYARSSGTTGVPKFMAKACAGVPSAVDMQRVAGARFVAVLGPLLSALTFRSVFATLLSGGGVCLQEGRPDTAGEAVALQRLGVELVIGSPAQAHRLCRGLAPLKQRIPALRVSGASVSAGELRHWFGFFDKVTVAYGARETGTTATVTITGADQAAGMAYTLEPDIHAEVVSQDGQPLPAETPGILRLRRTGMSTSYVGAPEATQDVFRDGWFYPGDLALLTADGGMKILGRVNDQLNLGGVKFNAGDIDDAARSVAGVSDAMCFTSQTAGGALELCLAAEAISVGSEPDLARAIRTACLRVNGSVRLNRIFFTSTLPLNDDGKPVRRDGPKIVSGLKSF